MQDLIKKNPIYVPRPEHNLSRHSISQAALNVLYQLHKSGYQAFLVGGGVRDVLLGQTPKDFDIVTNALPEQIRKLFRSCRLIGRRFVLAHVRFNREIVEVATFRASHDNGQGEGIVENGQIVRDNVYGSTVDDDAGRRDFTINAIYYDISDFSLLDYADGIKDLHDGIIRLIGNPVLRYQEDPVRMLRATRFAAKLGFSIAPKTAEPIPKLASLLTNIPPARLFEEVLKLFLSGHAVASFQQLYQYGLFQQLFPQTEACLEDPVALKLIKQVMCDTDERLSNKKSVTPAFFLAALLWPPLLCQLPNKQIKGVNLQEKLIETSQKLLARNQLQRVAIPRRITVPMQEIWLLQLRLTRQRKVKKKNLKLLEHPQFRAGYDFLLLRVKAGENHIADSANWWTDLLADKSITIPVSRRRRKKN
ncbi:polynucleotide adenylyltransferase PcnB [Candidatus Halobeggiatoa sp. HSG11]|nr:polynucleotide adenylyltransferase PcnB [Candidatus Halobeggiatoa sp. HSG11]